MGTHLKPCPSCGRHARISEAACPFCASRLPASFRTPPSIGQPARRLTRAALISLGAAAGAVGAVGTLSLLEGCGDDQGQDAGPGVISGGDAYGIAFDGGHPDVIPDHAAPDVADHTVPDVISFGDAYGIAFDGTPDTAVQDHAAPDVADTAAPDVISFGDAYGIAFDSASVDQATPGDTGAEASVVDATTDASESGD
jgi:hypothetical protein